MQSHRTPRRRWLRRTITAAVTAGALLIPTAAMARPAHASEPNGNAYGHATAPGQLKRQPTPPGDTTAPAVAIRSIQPTTLSPGQQATIWVDIADDSGQEANARVESAGFQPAQLSLTEQGFYEAGVTIDPAAPLGPLAWRVIASDAAGNTSTVEAPPELQLQIVAPADTAPTISNITASPTELHRAAHETAWIGADIADDSGQLAYAKLLVTQADGATRTEALRPVVGSIGPGGPSGHWEGSIQAQEWTPLGPLTFKVEATDAAGNVTTVDGPSLIVT